jgi:hypothetical protein
MKLLGNRSLGRPRWSLDHNAEQILEGKCYGDIYDGNTLA